MWVAFLMFVICGYLFLKVPRNSGCMSYLTLIGLLALSGYIILQGAAKASGVPGIF